MRNAAEVAARRADQHWLQDVTIVAPRGPQKRQEKAEAAAKPVFLTKQQRQELALKALEEKRSARERQLEQMR